MMKQWIQAVLLIAGLVWSAGAVAQVDDENLVQGAGWYDRMHQALRELNFDASFVHVRGQRVEPYRWLHGLSDNGQEVEVLSGLNGPEFKVLRHNNQSAYYHPMGSPYSMQSSVINGPIPAGFFRPYETVSDAYNVVSVGGGRVIDRAAQHIRVVARDQQRYGYSIWLDKETGMLLRAATLSVEGDVLEQVQLTSLFVSDEFPQLLNELKDITRPPLVEDNSNREAVQGNWNLGWIPDGFNLVRSNHHQMAVTGAQADYFLYSDGLAEFSVYISERRGNRGPLQVDGADSLFSTDLGNHRVTVLGRLPFTTVQRIARGVQGQP
ncbi:MucB/RseB C-terminal domain-containing protein [Aliidiomarina sp. Khilg15.8]